MRESRLDEIERAWQREPSDRAILKACTEDLTEYPPEVQRIIIIEAQKRCLVDSNGRPVEDCQDITETEQEDFSDTAEMETSERTFPCKEASDAFKFAIIGLLIIGIILEPIAISKALKAKKMINSNPRLTGSGKANAAIIIGIIYLILIITLILTMWINTIAITK